MWAGVSSSSSEELWEKGGGVFFFVFFCFFFFFSSFCLFSLSPLFSLMSACIVWFGLYGLYCLISLNGRTKKIFQLFYKSCKTEAKIVFWTLVWTRTLFTDICSWTPFTTHIWTWAWTPFDHSRTSSMFMKTVHEHVYFLTTPNFANIGRLDNAPCTCEGNE